MLIPNMESDNIKFREERRDPETGKIPHRPHEAAEMTLRRPPVPGQGCGSCCFPTSA